MEIQMREYKVNRENKIDLPSKETVGKYKDFSKLSHEYDKMVRRPKVPLYKDKKMFLVLLLIVLVAFVLSQLGEEQGTDENENPTPKEQVD